MSTAKPFDYYLTIIALPSLFIFFVTLVVIERIDIWGGVICFLFFGAFIYAYFGRYLSTVHLYNNRIKVKYLFSWKGAETFNFKSLVKIEHQSIPWITSSTRWYRAYQLLYMENAEGEVCKLLYHINDGEDFKLVQKLLTFKE